MLGMSKFLILIAAEFLHALKMSSSDSPCFNAQGMMVTSPFNEASESSLLVEHNDNIFLSNENIDNPLRVKNFILCSMRPDSSGVHA